MSLPVLDLRESRSNPEQFRAALRTATHEVGFFYLVGHGVAEDEVVELFALAREFFALPQTEKTAIEMTRSPHFRGYTRTGGELTQGQVDWREQLDIGAERAVIPAPHAADYLRLEGPNQWPAALPRLQEVFTDWSQRMSALGLLLMREWAESLGADRDFFDAAFALRPSTLLKLVRYPGRAVDEPQQGVGAHKDPGVLTLLLVEPGKAGLQVERNGTWVDAPPVPGAFVVNIGELLEFATDGYLKATNHRVVSPPAGEERLSIPFFFNPAVDSTVPKVTLPPELAAQARGMTEDPANPISGTFGHNLLKARLRAHPDVAARHHADLVGTGSTS